MSNEPQKYFKGAHRHYFADHQHCLKCGKWEGLADEDDCGCSDEDMDMLARKYGPGVRSNLDSMYAALEKETGLVVAKVAAAQTPIEACSK